MITTPKDQQHIVNEVGGESKRVATVQVFRLYGPQLTFAGPAGVGGRWDGSRGPRGGRGRRLHRGPRGPG